MFARFALTVKRLARRHNMPVAQIASELRCTEADVMEALRMLGAAAEPGQAAS